MHLVAVIAVVRLSVCRHVVLLEFNDIVPAGVQSLQPAATDSHRQQLNKMRLRQYRQMEAEYFSVSTFMRCYAPFRRIPIRRKPVSFTYFPKKEMPMTSN